MGVDFLKGKCKPFAKSWDADRLAANNIRRFATESELRGVATSLGSAILKEGDAVVVHAGARGLSVLSDLAPVARFVEPNADIVRAVEAIGGYARGRVEVTDAGGAVTIQIV